MFTQLKVPFRVTPRWQLWLLAGAILLLFVYIIVGERGALHLWRLRVEKAQLDEQNFRLQKENEALRQRVARLRHDDRYLEKIAREELNLVRPGEVIYRFPSTDSSKHRTSKPSELRGESPPSGAQKAPR